MNQLESVKAQNDMIIQLYSSTTAQTQPQQTYTLGYHRTPQASGTLSRACGTRQSYSGSACTCRSRPAPFFQSWGPVSFSSKTKDMHEKGCPLHHKSTRQTTLTIRLPLLQFILNASLGSKGFSFNQTVKHAARVIDWKNSEVAQLISELNECARNAIHSDVQLREEIMENWMEQLMRLFREGKASVDDQDAHGGTILWVSFINRLSLLRSACLTIGGSTFLEFLLSIEPL